MKFDIENKGNSILLSYKLDEKEDLDKFCYGMLVNNKIEGIATVIHSQKNTEKHMKFAVDYKTSFSEGFSGIISKERLLKIFDSLTSTLLKAEEYGISYSSFLLDADYAYFDSKTSKTMLLCVPINTFENEVACPAFCLSLLKKIQPDTKECYDAISKIGTFASDTANFSLLQMRDIVDELLGRPSRANLAAKEPVIPEIEPNSGPVFDESIANQAAFVMGARDISTSVQNPSGLKQPQMPQQVQTPVENAQQRKPATDFNIPRAVPGGGFAVPGGSSMPPVGQEKAGKPKKEKKKKEKKSKNEDKEAKPSLLAKIFIKQPKKEKTPAVAVPPAQGYGNMQMPGMNPIPPSPVVPQNSLKTPPVNVQPTMPPAAQQQANAYRPNNTNQPAQQGVAQPPVAYKPATPANLQSQQQNVNGQAKQAFRPVQPNTQQNQQQGNQAPAFNPQTGERISQSTNNDGRPQQIQISVQIPSQPTYNSTVDMPGFGQTVTVNSEDKGRGNQFKQQPQNGKFGETTVLNGDDTTVLYNGENPFTAKKYPKLIREKTGEEILINKPIFRIGKEKSYVDHFISDNSAISRSHANILTREGEHFIVDTNSTNHTYIDGKLIQSNEEYKIANGSKIKMANEDFNFIIES